jgi:capsular polysaccharide export protein
MPRASRDRGPGFPAPPTGSGLLKICLGPGDPAALIAMLPDFATEPHPQNPSRDRLSGVVAWSGSRYQGRARRQAAALDVPLVLFSCGLLRAPPGWGGSTQILSATAYTMVGPNSSADILDPRRLLATRGWEKPALLARAAEARRDISSRRLGASWWHSCADHGPLSQRAGFALIAAGQDGHGEVSGSRLATLQRTMLAAALTEYAPHQIVVLASNHVGRSGLVRNFLKDAASRGCAVLTRQIDLWEAIERADCVYSAGGETGFFALLAGARVRCFADSFYSGWGVTTDASNIVQKPFGRTIDEIFAGACLIATRYLDPYHRTAASFEEIVEILGEWRKIERTNRRIAVCLGMSFWKRRQVADFLRSSSGRPVFRRSARAALARARAQSGGTIAVWASRAPAGLAQAAKAQRIPLILVEDGFLRSVGLGSDFMPAASLVLGSRGMHFDPSVRSDLELLLSEAKFDAALVARARELITLLVARGVTKYNLGNRAFSLDWPPDRRRILVPGQVEDDLSVRLGGAGIRGNLELLGRIRAANPDAFILYKPHPDVEAGHRKGRIADEAARNFADTVIRGDSTAAVLAEVDELHTLTSLAGFEALLRGRRVVVYGRPFYAGWGLTTDLAEFDRGRQLSLEELVAGALILYPRYLDPLTRLPCGPEIIVERLGDPELWKPSPLVVARRLQGTLVRRCSHVIGRMSKFRAGLLSTSGRDDFRTPQP